MTSLSPAQQRLGRLEPFSKCTEDELAFIDGRIVEHHARAGDILTKEGRTAREWVVIAEGTAAVLVGTREVARLGPGDVIGELALLDRGPRTATVIAVTDIEAFVASHEEFLQILVGVPSIALALAVSLARRLRATNDLLTSAGRSARGRIG